MADESDDARAHDQLLRFLTRPGPRLRFALARVDDPRVAPTLRRQLEDAAAGLRIDTLVLDERDASHDLVERMHDAMQGDVLFVVGLARLLLDDRGATQPAASLRQLNQQRDELPIRLRGCIVLWLPELAFVPYAEVLRDFAEFVLTVVHFHARASRVPALRLGEFDGWMPSHEHQRDMILRRIGVLERMVAGTTDPLAAAELAADLGKAWLDLDDLERASEWVERAAAGFAAQPERAARELRRLALACSLRGELERAEGLSTRAIVLSRSARDELELARAFAVQADIAAMRGDLPGAWALLREQVLPRVRRDDAEHAATLGRLAKLEVARGEPEHALVHLQDQQAILVRLDDRRGLALSRRRTAAMLIELGELEQAGALLHRDVLPVFESLHDERERAISLGVLADLEFERGRIDAALRIRTDEQLPVFERLGDTREQDAARTKIAELEQARRNVARHEVSRDALALWREKLDFLLEQEPLMVDPAAKFKLWKDIEEARAKLRELGET